MSESQVQQTPRSRQLGGVRALVALVLGCVFLGLGISKLAGMAWIVESFRAWGYPTWFRYAIGLTETLAGVLVLVPATRALGAALIAIEMVGAIGTHVVAGQWALVPVPVVTLALALLLVSALRPRFEPWPS
jgi:uncharacterized membrane protein YphA (DoxX/SURF4 family)